MRADGLLTVISKLRAKEKRGLWAARCEQGQKIGHCLHIEATDEIYLPVFFRKTKSLA
jgi:hypothetical protein